MNNQRRLELARQHIKILKIIRDLKDISDDEKWAIDEIRNELQRELAESGHEKLDDIISLLDDAVNLVEEAAQGDYDKILQKEQRRQAQVAEQKRQQIIDEQYRKEAEEAARRQQEIDYFLKHVCPNPHNPDNYDIDSLEEFFEWKWQITDQLDQFGCEILEHTPAYKQYLKTV